MPVEIQSPIITNKSTKNEGRFENMSFNGKTSSAYHAVASAVTRGTGKADLPAQNARNRKFDP